MNILVALDYTHNREVLLEKGVQFASMMNGTLTILHVFSKIAQPGEQNVTDLNCIPTSTVSNEDFEAWCQAARESEAILQSIEKKIQSLGVAVNSQHLWGQAGPVICATAEHMKADVIMIGRRAEHQKGDRALGSVSNFVVHHAPCAVWIFQADDG